MYESIGIALATFVVLAIAFFGGFVSVVWTDMIQSIMMLVTLVVLPVIAFIYLYTNELSISQSLMDAGPSFDSWMGGATGFAIGALFFNNFSWFFGHIGGQPQLSRRYMAFQTHEARNTEL